MNGGSAAALAEGVGVGRVGDCCAIRRAGSLMCWGRFAGNYASRACAVHCSGTCVNMQLIYE